ncbi:hypothetical protein, conserved [Leishmania donovani]|uniref:Uncharacterized protein n=1 Tax=Leishmania donovani TaxID=5661 RepID=E9BDD7_LEIDO|nr:hypothetical protein, conserved [Leishmania donovani]
MAHRQSVQGLRGP